MLFKNGCVLEDDGAVLVKYIDGKTKVVVPEGVIEIGKEAFCETRITDVVMSDSVVKINSRAFAGCKRLKKVVFSKKLEVIADESFLGCEKLEELQLPDSLHGIGNGVFDGCSKLRRIIYKAKELDKNNIIGESGITSISDEKGIGVSEDIKKWCDNYTVTVPDGIKLLPEGIFDCFDADLKDKIKNVVLPNGLESIMDDVFNSFTGLVRVDIPNSVRKIGKRAFYGCQSLSEITIPTSLSVIREKTFFGCDSLSKVTVSDSVKKIENNAFAFCKELEEVKVESLDCEIAIGAFLKCHKLVDADGFTIIGNTLMNYEGAQKRVEIPEGVEVINNMAFLNPVNNPIEEIILPSTIRIIKGGAFETTKIRYINLPDSLEKLEFGAFIKCEIKEIEIPANVNSISGAAFLGCTQLEKIVVDEKNPNYKSCDGILYNKSEDTLVYCPGGKNLKEYVVSSNVSTIGDYAFSECITLEKIVIPANVKNLGKYLFSQSDSLTGLESNLKYIEVDPKAGSGELGEEIFGFEYGDKPLDFPKLPISLIKEPEVQIRLALGFCQKPNDYEDEYKDIYLKYVKENKKAVLKEAKKRKLLKAILFINSISS